MRLKQLSAAVDPHTKKENTSYSVKSRGVPKDSTKGNRCGIQNSNSELLASFLLPFPLPSINAVMNHKHWRTQKRVADNFKQAATMVLKPRRTVIVGCVKLTYTVYMKRLNNDPDNRYSKYVTDTVVKLGIIEGDSAECVRSVEHAIERAPGLEEFTVLEIYRAAAPAAKRKRK